MTKQIFYLKDKPDFYQHFGNPDDLIVWIYRWNSTRYIISDELHKLFTKHFNYN